VVLLSFGAFDVPGLDLLRLGGLKEYVFVVTPPLNVACLPANVLGLNELPADYVSLLAACDVVVTKPGYGIAADCLANRVAMLFADRGPFREYDVLAEALPRLGRARHIPRQDLLRADLGPHLDALLQSDARWIEQPMNGAEVVADRVVHRVTI
jgi:predicted glycosyltransferase